MPEVEKVEFSGAVLEGEVYLRAYDVTHALRGAIDYYAELIDGAADEAPEGSETEWYTSLVCWSSIIEALTAEADAYDVASMEFLAQHEDEDDE